MNEAPRQGQLCPMCQHGELVRIGKATWNCHREYCNNQFFLDTDGTLNVRDKPGFKPPPKRINWGWLRVLGWAIIAVIPWYLYILYQLGEPQMVWLVGLFQ